VCVCERKRSGKRLVSANKKKKKRRAIYIATVQGCVCDMVVARHTLSLSVLGAGPWEEGQCSAQARL
jgi:hypothetical protein